MERDLISDRTKDALQMKIANNKRAGQIPYGWSLSKDGNSLIMHQTQQEAIKLVRRLKGKGYSYRSICEELERKGFQPTGKRWHPKTIGSILKRAA